MHISLGLQGELTWKIHIKSINPWKFTKTVRQHWVYKTVWKKEMRVGTLYQIIDVWMGYILFTIFFCQFYSFVSFHDSHFVCRGMFHGLSLVSEVYITSEVSCPSFFFFSLPQINHFIWLIFKFTWFFCQLQSANVHILWIFYFSYCTFNPRIFIF